MKKIILLSTIMLTMLTTTITTPTVFADNETTESTEVVEKDTYKVIPILSEHQIDDDTGYYDIRWTPNTTEKIGVIIENNYDEDKTFTINVNKALTNANGALVYDDESQNNTGTYKISEQVILPEKVTVKANSEETIYGEVIMPDTELTGTLMGGVLVGLVDDNHEDEQVSINLNYAYPIMVRGEDEVNPNFDISFGDFNLMQNESGLFVIVTPWENKNATIARNVAIDLSIKDKDGNEIYGEERTEIFVTPETKIDYETLFSEDLTPGKYDVTLKITKDDEVYEETQEVEFTKEDVEEIRQTQIRVGKQVTETNNSIPVYVYIIAGAAVGTFGFFAYKKMKKY